MTADLLTLPNHLFAPTQPRPFMDHLLRNHLMVAAGVPGVANAKTHLIPSIPRIMGHPLAPQVVMPRVNRHNVHLLGLRPNPIPKAVAFLEEASGVARTLQEVVTGSQRISGAGRTTPGQSGENTPRHHSPQRAASSHSELSGAKEEGMESDNPSRASKNLQTEDATPEKNANEQMPPPRPPPTAPTGPASSKFSFAFKTTNKTPVATPKPEISQKFNTAPRKEPPPPIDDRDRDLPRDTPREPASARARADYHSNRAPPEPPRTRKVKRIQRRLKPKPELPADLATSDSVFFRKPGNESVVGSGTYGKVFKGVHVYTKRLVALKKIRMEGERDGFPVTAVREIKLLQSLKHTNIVNLQEVMVEKNDCFMVFEYLSHDLTGLLNHPSYKLDPAQKKHLALQLFEGLDYLHKRGVLHRDIKAANILVSNDGILKLADFGLARFYAKHHQLDYTNRVITIWYRSPELLLGETRYGAAVDIWSAACVMVEIFTRHAIFPGDGGEINQLEKIYAILGTPNKIEWPGLIDMPWFELLRPGYRRPNVFAEKYKERVPAAAFDLLASMFQYDPVKRPSAAEVLEHPYFTEELPPPRQAIEFTFKVTGMNSSLRHYVGKRRSKSEMHDELHVLKKVSVVIRTGKDHHQHMTLNAIVSVHM
ncbi:serine/threonine protein kinase, CMGC, CDC2/CDK subfamily [Parahypoxylon ruwenzoriense]